MFPLKGICLRYIYLFSSGALDLFYIVHFISFHFIYSGINHEHHSNDDYKYVKFVCLFVSTDITQSTLVITKRPDIYVVAKFLPEGV